MWLDQAALARANSLALLLFSSSKENEGVDCSVTHIGQDVEILQRNGCVVVGARASILKEQAAHGGMLPCALNSLSQNLSGSALWLLLNFTEQQKMNYAASLWYEI